MPMATSSSSQFSNCIFDSLCETLVEPHSSFLSASTVHPVLTNPHLRDMGLAGTIFHFQKSWLEFCSQTCDFPDCLFVLTSSNLQMKSVDGKHFVIKYYLCKCCSSQFSLHRGRMSPVFSFLWLTNLLCSPAVLLAHLS